MVRAGQEVIVVEPSSARRRSWSQQGKALGVAIRPCETLEEAAAAMREAPPAAVVATTSASASDAVRFATEARELVPPAELVFVTDDPDALKSALRARGLTAEVLRSPATIPQLVDRLGLSSYDPPAHSKRGEPG
jgi:hypothetical protein